MKHIVLIIGATKQSAPTPKQQLQRTLGVQAVEFIHRHLNKPVTKEQAEQMWDNMNQFNREITLESYALVSQRRN